MALRNQPYIPLYVNDFMSDEKLAECSAAATGVYIRMMCLMHKSEHYGKILLKQNDKQMDNQVENFALKIARHLPYNSDVVLSALVELLDNRVIEIEGDSIIQKRMVKDGELSSKRAAAGTKGGKKTQSKTKEIDSSFAKANLKANSEIEIDIVNDNSISSINTNSYKRYVLIDDFQDQFRKSEMFNNLKSYFGFTNEKMSEWLYEFVKFKKASVKPNDEFGNLIEHMRNWITKKMEKEISNGSNKQRNTSERIGGTKDYSKKL